MKKHQYRISVEHIADKEGNPVEREPLQFEAANHDDIFRIVSFMKDSGRFSDEADAMHFAVGLKLFSEVILEHKSEPFFSELSPHFMEIMKIIKNKKGE
ncbi:hypothetical protein J2T38_000236 [Neisseria perflava]|uniref:DUF3861 domain-containing protein n=1 Tax=Neisseria perflava TaxID=33053 RepID=UPI00209FA2D8|nr:DUF3861 domain-containing protein [Neisseria perflava]MCP1771444.1 hypothetical protein [Neisseria perflava]